MLLGSGKYKETRYLRAILMVYLVLRKSKYLKEDLVEEIFIIEHISIITPNLGCNHAHSCDRVRGRKWHGKPKYLQEKITKFLESNFQTKRK